MDMTFFSNMGKEVFRLLSRMSGAWRMDSFPADRLPQAGCLLGWGLFLLEGRCPGAVEAYTLLAAWKWMGFLFPARVSQSGECMFPGKSWVPNISHLR